MIINVLIILKARDTKAAADAGSNGPNRKERAEIEALKATIQKLKIDHEEAQKKWKSNGARCSISEQLYATFVMPLLRL